MPNVGNVKFDEDLSHRQLEASRAMRALAKACVEECWRHCIEIYKEVDYTGQEVLGHLSTLSSYVLCNFIKLMKKVGDSDESDYSKEDFLLTIFEGTKAIMQTKNNFDPIPEFMSNGIKTINSITKGLEE